MQAKNEPETAVQKLNRIQCELAELQEELATPKVYLLVLLVKEFMIYLHYFQPEEVTTIGSLTAQVEFLQKQLMAIKLQETAGVSFSESHWLTKK